MYIYIYIYIYIVFGQESDNLAECGATKWDAARRLSCELYYMSIISPSYFSFRSHLGDGISIIFPLHYLHVNSITFMLHVYCLLIDGHGERRDVYS